MTPFSSILYLFFQISSVIALLIIHFQLIVYSYCDVHKKVFAERGIEEAYVFWLIEEYKELAHYIFNAFELYMYINHTDWSVPRRQIRKHLLYTKASKTIKSINQAPEIFSVLWLRGELRGKFSNIQHTMKSHVDCVSYSVDIAWKLHISGNYKRYV